MDFKQLADTLTEFLAPALPYLVSGGQELVKETGKELADQGPDLLKKLWTKLRPKVEVKPAAAEAVQDVARAPEDSRTQGALSLQLEKILAADSSLAAEVEQLLAAAGPKITYHAEVHGSGAIAQGKGNVVAGDGGMASGRDLRISK